MLQTLHDKFSGTIAKIVLAVIVFVFGGFFGLQSYMTTSSETWVAKVNGKEIDQSKFQEAYNRVRAQYQQMFGAQFDAAAFDTPARKRQVLDQLVDEQLLTQLNDKLGIMVPPAQVREVILGYQAFQKDGKFDKDLYLLRLQAAGLTAEAFQNDIIKDIAVRQLPGQLAQLSVVPDAQIGAFLRLRDQTRDFGYLKLDKPAADGAKIADADLDAYYKSHAAEFMTPEKVSLDYIDIDAAKMQADAAPDDALLKKRYEEQQARFTTSEQRLVSHILVKTEKNANAEQQKAALEKAKAIEAEIRGGKDFATVAKAQSDDLGSKSQGGDLGWIEKGVTDPAFETALFAMKKGEMSDPVLSSEGYHIIELRDVREGKVRPFEEVKAELAKQYQETEHERRYSELSGKLVDALGNDPSLSAAAKAFDLPLQKTALFTRDGGEDIAKNPAVVKAAFSNGVLNEGNTSAPIKLGPDHIVFIHVDQHEKPVPQGFDAVREEIRARLLAEQVAKAAKEQADTLLGRLQKGESLDALAAVVKGKVEWEKGIGRNAANLDGAIVGEVFKLARPASPDKPVPALVALPGDAYALVVLTAVADADPAKFDAKARDSARSQIAQGYSQETVKGFLDLLRKSADVKIAEDRLQ